MSEQQSTYNIEQIRKENAVLRKYAAIQQAFEDKIGVQKVYIDIADDIEAAFVLDEIIFFTLPRPDKPKSALRIWKDGVLWMAVSRSEWWERKRLSARQADRAIDKLLKKNLIFKTLHRFNGQATTHLRLNVPEFFRLYSEALEKANPPENENDTIIKDISDLYAMMGEPEEVLPNGDTPPSELPDGDEVSPDGDTVSPNGDSINIPHTPSTQPSDIDSKIFTALSELTGGMLNTETPRFVDIWKEKHTLEWILKAIQLTKDKNVRGAGVVKYANSILIGWEANGYPKSREQQVAERRNGKPNNNIQDALANWVAKKEQELQNGNAS